MFHTYVINSAGQQISINRALNVMANSIVTVMDHALSPQEWWREYCRRHKLVFGQDFPPDQTKEPY